MNLIPWRNKGANRLADSGERSLTHLRDEVDHVFERFFRDPWCTGLWDSLWPSVGVSPRMDLAESENDVTVTAELPGIDPKDVELNVTGNVLTIRGEKKQEKEERKRNYHSVERQYGGFQRSIQLPSTVDADKVDATYKDGILTVTLAKHPEARPKRITVKSE